MGKHCYKEFTSVWRHVVILQWHSSLNSTLDMNMNTKKQSLCIINKIINRAQNARNEALGKKLYSESLYTMADKALSIMCTRKGVTSKLIKSCEHENYISEAARFSLSLYDGSVQKEIESIIKRDTNYQPAPSRLAQVQIILFRESFIGYSLSDSLKNPMEYLYDLKALEHYAISGCIPLSGRRNEFAFFHDTWTRHPWRAALELRPDAVCIYHPCYEVTIVGFLLSILSGVITGIATYEYTEWRNKQKKRKTKEAVDVLTHILFESRVRFEILPIKESQSREGCYATHSEIAHKYLEEYIPLLKRVRKSGEAKIPSEYISLYTECKELAEQMISEIIK